MQGTSLLLQASCEKARKRMVYCSVLQKSGSVSLLGLVTLSYTGLHRGPGVSHAPCHLLAPHLFLRHGAMVQQQKKKKKKAGDRGQRDVPCHSHTVRVGDQA